MHNPVSRATVVIQRQAEAPPGVNSPSDTVQMKCFCSHSNAISSLATSPRIKVSTGSGVINTHRKLILAPRVNMQSFYEVKQNQTEKAKLVRRDSPHMDFRGAQSGVELACRSGLKRRSAS